MPATFRLHSALRRGFQLPFVLATFLMLLIAAPVEAHGYKIGDLVIEHPWTRATAPGAEAGGGFLVIHNNGTTADRLVGGTAEFAAKVEIHEMAMEGETMKMRQLVDGLEIPAGATLTLKPGSFHVMFQQLQQPLAEGSKVKGTLVFAKAGTLAVEWKVEAKGASAPGHAGAAPEGDHDMSAMPGMPKP